MAVQIVDIAAAPRRAPRNLPPKIMQSEDWIRAFTILHERAFNPQQALLISFTKEEMKKYGVANIRAAARPIRKYLKKTDLPYKVSTKTTAEGGVIIFKWVALSGLIDK